MPHDENTKTDKDIPPTVLVFGGSGVIGRAIAREFARQRWSVGVHYHQNHVSAMETIAAIQEARGTAKLYQADVKDPLQIRNIIQIFLRDHLSLSLLVWAVGIAPTALVTKTDSEAWEATLQTNLTGAFHVLREAAPTFEQQQRGGVILIGSLSGEHGLAGQTAYAASKAGLIGLMRSTAREWGNRNIRVNTVFPGWHASPLSSSGFDSALAHQSHILDRTPSLEHMAAIVYHLASTPDISGQTWNLDSRI